MARVGDRIILEEEETEYIERFKLNSITYKFKLKPETFTPGNFNAELYESLEQLARNVTVGLDPENDRIAIQFQHPDLRIPNFGISFRRPSHVTGQKLFSQIAKTFQSDESMATVMLPSLLLFCQIDDYICLFP